MEIIIHNLKHGLMITIFVFVMMVFIDYLGVLTRGKFNTIVKGGLFRQYVIAAFLGATPGCLGAFMCVSFYIHGLISFGALTGAMIATAGDESYVMFAMIPKQAFIIHLVLFILGIIFAALVDKTIVFLKIKPCQECSIPNIHLEDEECRCLNKIEIFGNLRDMSFVRFLLLFFVIISLFGFLSGSIGPEKWDWMRITFVVLLILTVFIFTTVPEHYLEEHIWKHIVKKHLWKIFLWTFGVLLITDIGLKFWNLDAFIKSRMPWVLLLAAIIGIIPESGPHLIFVTLFANGSIPFSVLLTSSIVQDGHGMLPLLSYTLRDSLLIKIFNLIIGLGLGLLLLSLGY